VDLNSSPSARSSLRPRLITVVFVALMMASLAGAGCFGGGADSGMVRGLVIEVVDRDITQIETLRIRDDSGRLWTFTTVADIGMSGSHVRLHGVLGESVLVTWTEKDGRLIATQIGD